MSKVPKVPGAKVAAQKKRDLFSLFICFSNLWVKTDFGWMPEDHKEHRESKQISFTKVDGGRRHSWQS